MSNDQVPSPEKIVPPAPRVKPEAYVEVFEGSRGWDKGNTKVVAPSPPEKRD
jgi:hypothetical protein